ncbi:flagellar basal body rod protein FlgB [bacterium]|nr:flagellar basal body rod protein FlgB [bacterium]
MNPVPDYDPLVFGETALRLRTYRQQILGSNLANADTPGFRAKDVNFAAALREQLEGQAYGSRVPLTLTSSGHMPSSTYRPGMPTQLFRTSAQPTMDGNTVDLDIERSHFAENVTKTEAQMRFLAGAFRSRVNAMTPDGR